MDINDIRKKFLKNSMLTWAMVFIAGLSMTFAFVTMKEAKDESRKYIYLVQTDGEVVPLVWADRRENLGIEMKNHITMFVENFYSLNQYSWENKIERALWLGDFEQLHRRRQSEGTGYYNRFIQYGYTQEATLFPENIELRQEAGKTLFYIIINITEEVQSKKARYAIFAKGEISVTDRNFPLNPHGLFIKNYIEEKVVKE